MLTLRRHFKTVLPETESMADSQLVAQLDAFFYTVEVITAHLRRATCCLGSHSARVAAWSAYNVPVMNYRCLQTTWTTSHHAALTAPENIEPVCIHVVWD